MECEIGGCGLSPHTLGCQVPSELQPQSSSVEKEKMLDEVSSGSAGPEVHAPNECIPTFKSFHAVRSPSHAPLKQLECFKIQASTVTSSVTHLYPNVREAGSRPATLMPKGAGEEPRHSPDSRQSTQAAHAPHNAGSPGQKCCRGREVGDPP